MPTAATTLRLLTALALAGVLPAQQRDPPRTGSGGEGTGGVIEWPPRQDFGRRWPRQVDPYYTFPGIESVSPEFRGFPLYAPDAPAFGGYPGLPGFRPEVLKARGDSPTSLLLPPAEPRPPGLWPSWLVPAAGAEESRADQAMLVRSSDRVWLRAAGEEAYVPVPFHDRIRMLEPGAGVQVRTMSGDFTVFMHDGASLQSVGPVHLETQALDDTVAEFELLDAYHLRLEARKRTVRLRLLDGSLLEATETAARIERSGDRVIVLNTGSTALLVRAPAATVEVPPNREVALLATPPPPDAPSTALWLRGTAQSRSDGPRLDLDGGSGGGTVEWLGARITLGAGATARLEALGGESFPEYRGAGRKQDGGR